MISFRSNNLANYIMFKLDKVNNEFSLEELSMITELVINYDEEDNDSKEELLKLPNLEKIVIRFTKIYSNDYLVFLGLKKLNNITFESCEFEDSNMISYLNLKSLSMINCNVENYNFIDTLNKLEELTIINGNVDISRINKHIDLRYLQLSYSNITLDNEFDFPNLEELYIDNSNIKNLGIIKNISNLKRLSIDDSQYKNNKDLVKLLLSKDVLVLNENIGGFEGD